MQELETKIAETKTIIANLVQAKQFKPARQHGRKLKALEGKYKTLKGKNER